MAIRLGCGLATPRQLAPKPLRRGGPTWGRIRHRRTARYIWPYGPDGCGQLEHEPGECSYQAVIKQGVGTRPSCGQSDDPTRVNVQDW